MKRNKIFHPENGGDIYELLNKVEKIKQSISLSIRGMSGIGNVSDGVEFSEEEINQAVQEDAQAAQVSAMISLHFFKKILIESLSESFSESLSPIAKEAIIKLEDLFKIPLEGFDVASKITKEELKDALDIIENHFPSEHKQLLKKLGIPFESKEDELARRVINKEIPGTRSLFKIPVKEILTLDNVGNIMKTCPKIIKDINTVSDAKRKRIASVYREIQRVRKNLKNISPKGYELLVGLNAFLDKEVGGIKIELPVPPKTLVEMRNEEFTDFKKLYDICDYSGYTPDALTSQIKELKTGYMHFKDHISPDSLLRINNKIEEIGQQLQTIKPKKNMPPDKTNPGPISKDEYIKRKQFDNTWG